MEIINPEIPTIDPGKESKVKQCPHIYNKIPFYLPTIRTSQKHHPNLNVSNVSSNRICNGNTGFILQKARQAPPMRAPVTTNIYAPYLGTFKINILAKSQVAKAALKRTKF